MVYKRCLTTLVVLLAMVLFSPGSFLMQPGVASAHGLGVTMVHDDCVSINCPDDTNHSLTP